MMVPLRRSRTRFRLLPLMVARRRGLIGLPVLLGFRTISHEVVGPNGNRTVNRITAGFKVPVVATINTVDTVVRYSSAQIIWNIHPDSTLQERKDLHAYVTNYCGNASVKLSIENVEPFY